MESSQDPDYGPGNRDKEHSRQGIARGNTAHKDPDAVQIPVVACGGAGKVEDFQDAVKRGGASAVAAGSFFVFQGKHRAVLINMPTMEELDQLSLP